MRRSNVPGSSSCVFPMFATFTHRLSMEVWRKRAQKARFRKEIDQKVGKFASLRFGNLREDGRK
jgi:hypothetical protein